MSTLLEFVNELAVQGYKDQIVDTAKALAYEAGSLFELEQLRRDTISDIAEYAQLIIPGTQHEVIKSYYEAYVVLAVASAFLKGVRNVEDLHFTIIPASLEELSYMEKFIDDTIQERVTENQFNARILAYLAAPAFFWGAYAEDILRRREGATQAKRNCVEDDRSCGCCVKFGKRGWVSLSDPLPLPLPGQKCDCYKNCRCEIEYR